MATGSAGVAPKWCELFDSAYLDSGCAAVRDAVAERREGGTDTMSPTLQRLLIDLLDAYIADHLPPVASTSKTIVKDGRRVPVKPPALHASQTRLAASWRSADERGLGRGRAAHIDAANALKTEVCRIVCWLQCPLLELDAEETYTKLRTCWRDFIIAGAAPLIYGGIPQQRKQASLAASAPRGGAKGVTSEAVARCIEKLESEHCPKAVELAAKELGISESTARRRLKRLDEAGTPVNRRNARSDSR